MTPRAFWVKLFSKAAKPAVPLADWQTGPMPVPMLPPHNPHALVHLSEVPQSVIDRMQTATRTDSFLDGLIGTSQSTAGGGWLNPLTGHGTRGRDKVMAGRFDESVRIDDPQLTALYNGNDLAKRIIESKAKEMFRRGWVLALPGMAPAGASKIPVAGVTPNKAGGFPSKAAPNGTDATLPAEQGKKVTPKAPAGASGQPAEPLQATAPEPQEKDPPPAQGGDASPYDLNSAQTAGEGESGPPAPSAVAVAVPGAVTQGQDGTGGTGPGDQQSGADLAKQIEKYGERLQLVPRCQESVIFGRTYGGGLLIIGADDGQDVSLPLDETNVKSIAYLAWIDRRFIVAHTYYEEIGPKYGEVAVWNIINPFGNQKNTLVHESRVIRFDGAPVDLLMRRRLAGWTLSVLQAPYDTMRQFDMSFQSVSNLMGDISQAVMHIDGLMQMISQDQKTLQTRMQMVDMARSTVRMIYLDSENEKFERVATPLTGVAETLEMQMLRLAAAAEMPVAILFGREPSGLNATGDADFRRFYDMIAGDQKQVLEPKLLRLYTLICLAKDGPCKGKVPDGGLEFTWHKLYEPSELEQSTIRWNMAQADDKYIQNNTLLPEEVAMSRFRSGDLHLDTEIQGDLRRQKLQTAQLAPSGAEKAQQDQKNTDNEMKIKAQAATAKPGAPGGGSPPPK